MNATKPIELAQHYVALSNTHDLDATMRLFAEDAVYESAFVGKMSGKAAIQDMMSEYFLTVPNVCWKTNGYQLTRPYTVRFSFKMTGTQHNTGEIISRSDIEEIEFNSYGLICNVKVGASLIVD